MREKPLQSTEESLQPLLAIQRYVAEIFEEVDGGHTLGADAVPVARLHSIRARRDAAIQQRYAAIMAERADIQEAVALIEQMPNLSARTQTSRQLFLDVMLADPIVRQILRLNQDEERRSGVHEDIRASVSEVRQPHSPTCPGHTLLS